MARSLAALFEALTVIGGIVAGLLLFAGMTPGQTAIQTGASAAAALGFVAIPYCIAGAFHRASVRALMRDSLAQELDDEEGLPNPSGAQPTVMQRLWWNPNGKGR